MRIVSLLPSATEILFAVGAGPEVVGVTHECDHPAQTAGLPVLTSNALIHEGHSPEGIDRHIQSAVHAGSSIYRLDERLLRELAPDLIVTQELCEVCAVAYTEVERAARRLPGEIPVVSLEPLTLAEICATVRTIGRFSGHQDEATRVAAEMEARIAAVAKLPRPGARPRVACIEWTAPLMAGGHWVPDMVEVAGGIDCLGTSATPSHYVDWSELVAAHPDILVLMPCGYDLDHTVELANEVVSRPEFSDLPASTTGLVAAVDGSSYFNRPGPRIVDGLEILAALVRAEAGSALPRGACWVLG
ncbi:MAG TPA: cobalamin-binding protein [Candidatus Dormibacteraeota bacterium]